MRKLGRILRRCLTTLSLLLLVAVLAAWVRGYWSRDIYWLEREWIDRRAWQLRGWQIQWGRGDIGLMRMSFYTESTVDLPSGYVIDKSWTRAFRHEAPESTHGKMAAEAYSYAFVLAPAANTPFPGQMWDRCGIFYARNEQHETFGFSLLREKVLWPPPVNFKWQGLAFPCWMAAVVFGALPSWRLVAWWRSRRRRLLALREGRCPLCGYDLRASPERCPECGLAVEEKREDFLEAR